MTRPRPQPDAAKRDELQLLTEAEVSALLSMPPQTLRNQRSKRRGIPFIRLGRSVRYRRVDVERFIARATVNMGGE